MPPSVSSLTIALALALCAAVAILPTSASVPIIVGNHGSASQILVDDTATEITTSWRTTGAVIVDIDSDRDLDVVFANGVNEYNFAESNRVAINSVSSVDGPSSFQFNIDDSSDLPGGWANSRCVAAADFNGDGHVDLVFGNAIAGREWSSRNTLLLSTGDADGGWSFETPVDFILPSVSRTPYSPASLAVADIDGDGDLDILSGSNPGYLILYVNQLVDGWDGSPDTLFVEDRSGVRVPAVANVIAMATGDLDGRNGVDIVLGTGLESSTLSSIENQVLLNDGTGHFTGQSLPGNGDGIITRAVAVGDVNGDGYLDIVLGNCKYEDQYSGVVGAPNLLLLNDGSAAFSSSELVGGQVVTNAIALGDSDGRGEEFVDILIGNNGVSNQKLVNDGSGSFTENSLPGSFSDTRFIGLLSAQIEEEEDPDINIDESSSGCGGCEIININTPTDVEIICTFNSTVGIPTKAELIVGSCTDFGNREAGGEIETDGQVQDSIKFNSEITLEEKNSGAPFFKEFCLRGDLLKYDYWADIMRSVFARKCAINATLTYEVRSGFSVEHILIEEFVAEATDASATREEDVLAYRCNDDGSEASQDAISIGSVLNICVYSPKSDITVEVSSLDLKFENAVLTSPITGSVPNFVTVVSDVSVTGKSDSVQMVKTLMTPVVFDSSEGEVITASGTANLFYTSPRLNPDSPSRRALQDGESSVFNLDIGVAEYRQLPQIASMGLLGNGAKSRFFGLFSAIFVVFISSIFILMGN